MNIIDVALVQRLIAEQFPQWQNLSIQQVLPGGWDNRTFRLGNDKLIRLPSGADYADKVAKEQYWLPKLAASLSLPIPQPLAMGKPTIEYPWSWSVYRWLEGETAASMQLADLTAFSHDLAHFLTAFQQLDTTGGPPAGAHNFYRGGSLTYDDEQTRQAIQVLKGKIDTNAALLIWRSALETVWEQPPVWVHGDISAGNLLVQNEG